MKKLAYVVAVLLPLAAFASLPVLAQTKSATSSREFPMASAKRVDHAPKLDGTLDDPLWQRAEPVE